MLDFSTEDLLFGFAKVGDVLESVWILCGEGTFLEQLFEGREAVCPRELCSVVHELLVGQARERVGELGVDI